MFKFMFFRHGHRRKVQEAKNKMAIHYSSKRDDWETPPWLYKKLNEEFGFLIDAACSSKNRLAPSGYQFDKGVDGLKANWNEYAWTDNDRHFAPTVFVNPPYGRGITAKWVAKGYEEAKLGATVVMLIPARTSTKAWHMYCMKAHEVRLCKGRLVFQLNGKQILDKHGRPMPAPFPSAVVVFRPGVATTKFSTLNTERIERLSWRDKRKGGDL